MPHRLPIPATVENMKHHARHGLVLLDPATGDTFSATPGDYFMVDPQEELTNGDGEPLVLAIRHAEHAAPLYETEPPTASQRIAARREARAAVMGDELIPVDMRPVIEGEPYLAPHLRSDATVSGDDTAGTEEHNRRAELEEAAPPHAGDLEHLDTHQLEQAAARAESYAEHNADRYPETAAHQRRAAGEYRAELERRQAAALESLQFQPDDDADTIAGSHAEEEAQRLALEEEQRGELESDADLTRRQLADRRQELDAEREALADLERLAGLDVVAMALMAARARAERTEERETRKRGLTPTDKEQAARQNVRELEEALAIVRKHNPHRRAILEKLERSDG